MAETVFADELGSALDGLESAIDVLSLDCFDTLIWRSTPEPPDIFCELHPPLTRMSRMVAEQTARERNLVGKGKGEVTLDEIYRCALPSADAAEIQRRIEQELALEHRHCLAFTPAVDLIRRARLLGKRVIVVSDTYLRAEELQALIGAKVGAEVFAMIDRIYCSSAFGRGKSNGLFRDVLADLKVAPERILHIGDSPKADVDGAASQGLRHTLLLQGDRALLEQWRLELAALLMTDSRLRDRVVPLLPQRPLLARTLRRLETPAARLGFGTMGPLMDGFVRWVRDEAKRIEAAGTRVKLCFLMRDGYLPLQVYQRIAGDGDPVAVAIELSRFVAFGATFSTPADVDAYLGMMSETARLDALARQLLFTRAETEQLLPSRGQSMAIHQFADRVRRPPNLKKVFERSAQSRTRLFGYLRRVVDPQPGETLLLVDIGAAGTVQNRVQSVIAEEFGVAVEGRYLLLRDVPRATERKRGYFGPDRLDGRLLESLYNYIAVVEQLCTVEQGSVVGYDDRGEPQRKAASFAAHQVEDRRQVQKACLEFIAERSGCTMGTQATTDPQANWHGALAAFGRLLFLPTQDEIGFFERFAHDMNLGIRETVPLVDRKAAQEDLRRIGPMYPKSSLRVFAPAELRACGLDLALLQFARRRLDLDLRPQDFQATGFELPVMIARGQQASVVTIEALPTHEGFLAASIPVGRCEYAVGVLFGQICEWLQLESARLVSAKRQLEAAYRDDETDLTSTALFEGLTRHSGGVIHCAARDGFLYFAEPDRRSEDSHVLRVVFRPLVHRVPLSPADTEAAATMPATSQPEMR